MKHFLYSILVGLSAVVGCRERMSPPDSRGAAQRLDLSVSIDQGASKAPITGVAFGDGTHQFGLAVTKTDGLTAYEAGADKILASAEISATSQTWSYQWGEMTSAGSVLPLLYGGDPMQVAGYYPYNEGAAALAGRDGGRLNVPFDLTAPAELSNQTDVFFSGLQTVSYASGARQSVALSFRHVYALLEFQVKLKTAVQPASITKVEVCNKAGKPFLSNKGFFSPYTGAVTASTAGNVSLTTSTALNGSTYATIRVLVPPTLLEGYQDGDIYVQMYDNGVADPKQFPILRSYLTQSGTYGLVGGGKYSFKLLYDNRGSGSITVVDWNSTLIDHELIGSGVVNPPTASDYIEIGGIKWAKGNLVAKNANECKVGAPTDYGVYFRFGSLVGWTGGATGDGTGIVNISAPPATAVQVKPATYSGGTSWTTVGRYIDEGTAGTDYGLPGSDNASTGIGDPCRYYLGAQWRTPTAAQYLTLLGASGAKTNKALPLKVNNYDLSFPASGYRHPYGAIGPVGSNGLYWSSSVGSATYGHDLTFYSGIVNSQYRDGRAGGVSVRCVASS